MDDFEIERIIMGLSRQVEDMAYRLSIVEESAARLFAYLDDIDNKRNKQHNKTNK